MVGTQSGKIKMNIEDLAWARRLTKSELARKAGLTYVTVSKLWKGDSKRVEIATIAGLCSALEVEVGELFEFIPDNGVNGEA